VGQSASKAAETIKNAGAQPDLSFWAKKEIMKNILRLSQNPSEVPSFLQKVNSR
jgi:hypothetical protein